MFSSSETAGMTRTECTKTFSSLSLALSQNLFEKSGRWDTHGVGSLQRALLPQSVEHQCIQKWHPPVSSGSRGQALMRNWGSHLPNRSGAESLPLCPGMLCFGLEGVQYHTKLKPLYLSNIKLDKMLFYYRDLLDVVSCNHTSLEIPEQTGCAWGSTFVVQTVLVLCYRSSLQPHCSARCCSARLHSCQ